MNLVNNEKCSFGILKNLRPCHSFILNMVYLICTPKNDLYVLHNRIHANVYIHWTTVCYLKNEFIKL